jgi:hypothetical protein
MSDHVEVEKRLNLDVRYREIGGVTESSLTAARKLIPYPHQYPSHIVLVQDRSGYYTYVLFRISSSRPCESVVALQFDGFSWGYSGEGPRGLQALFELCDYLPPEYLPPAGSDGAWICFPDGRVRSIEEFAYYRLV